GRTGGGTREEVSFPRPAGGSKPRAGTSREADLCPARQAGRDRGSGLLEEASAGRPPVRGRTTRRRGGRLSSDGEAPIRRTTGPVSGTLWRRNPPGRGAHRGRAGRRRQPVPRPGPYGPDQSGRRRLRDEVSQRGSPKVRRLGASRRVGAVRIVLHQHEQGA